MVAKTSDFFTTITIFSALVSDRKNVMGFNKSCDLKLLHGNLFFQIYFNPLNESLNVNVSVVVKIC